MLRKEVMKKTVTLVVLPKITYRDDTQTQSCEKICQGYLICSNMPSCYSCRLRLEIRPSFVTPKTQTSSLYYIAFTRGYDDMRHVSAFYPAGYDAIFPKAKNRRPPVSPSGSIKRRTFFNFSWWRRCFQHVSTETGSGITWMHLERKSWSDNGQPALVAHPCHFLWEDGL
jgi:hypothetical protein